jgi:hypothetical protein
MTGNSYFESALGAIQIKLSNSTHLLQNFQIPVDRAFANIGNFLPNLIIDIIRSGMAPGVHQDF